MLKKREIYITDIDYERLSKMLNIKTKKNNHKQLILNKLSDKLKRAVVVPARNIPKNVFTMNSEGVFLNLFTKHKASLKLVFPSERISEREEITVLTSVGVAVLGSRVGDVIEYQISENELKWLIAEQILYQPEAAGHFC